MSKKNKRTLELDLDDDQLIDLRNQLMALAPCNFIIEARKPGDPKVKKTGVDKDKKLLDRIVLDITCTNTRKN